MSSYFDAIGSELNRLARGPFTLQMPVETIEKQLVRDVSICSEMPGCPEDIRDAINRAVFNYAPGHQPDDRMGTDPKYPSPDDAAGYVRMVTELNGRLHDIFHDLARRHLPGFNDNPTRPLVELLSAASERRGAFIDPQYRRPPLAE